MEKLKNISKEQVIEKAKCVGLTILCIVLTLMICCSAWGAFTYFVGLIH